MRREPDARRCLESRPQPPGAPGGSPRGRAPVAILFACLLVSAMRAGAQDASPVVSAIERPGDRRPAPEPPTIEERAPAPILPPVPAPSLGEIQGDDPTAAIQVDEIRFEGNTVLDDATLAEVVRGFVGQRLSVEGLEAMRRQVTALYVSRGYVTSGATLPPQDLASGRLVVRIVEGRLESIDVLGAKHYREGVIAARLEREVEGPLSIEDLERAIRLLDQDVRIDRIDARLRPGSARGLAILEVRVEEAPPSSVTLRFANDQSPSIGSYGGRLTLGHDNVFGLGDGFVASVLRTEGLTRVSGSYELPIHPSGTRLFADASYGSADLVDNVLRRLRIGSEDASFGVGVRHKAWHTPSDRVDIGLLLERRRSKTFLGDEGWSSIDGPQNGRSEVTALRWIIDWTHRGDGSVLAFRSMASWGTDWWNPTTQPGGTPDGTFLSWYGQLRTVHRLPGTDLELAFRTDVQLTDRPMLPLEQFAIGGQASVRGYRQNQVVADQGISAAVDLRVPVWQTADARTLLAVTPFLDFGYAWNRRRDSPPIRTLSSIGVGVEWVPLPDIEIGVEWAHGFRNTGDSGDLQDESLHLRATWRMF